MAENAFLTGIETAGALQNMQAQRQQMGLQQQQMQLKQDEAQQAADMKRQFAADLQAAYQDPNQIQALGKVMTMYPAMADNIKKGLDVYQGADRQRNLTSLAQAAAALDAGDLAATRAVVEQNMPLFMTMPEQVRKNPDMFKRAVMTQLAATGKEGQAVLTSMGWTPKAQLEQQQFGLERQKFQNAQQKQAFDQKIAERKLELEARGVAVQEGQLQQAYLKVLNPELSAGLQKMTDDAVTSSLNASGASATMRSLADQAERLNWSGGAATKGSEAWKQLWGSEDSQSSVIKQIDQVFTTDAFKYLPVGSVSEKEFSAAKATVLSPTANAKQVADALRKIARINDQVSAVQQAKADFISENGGLGKAKRDIVLSDGLTIPAGTAYSDVLKSAAKNATVIWENHPKKGRITELDIEATMKANRMTRQQVIDAMRKVQ